MTTLVNHTTPNQTVTFDQHADEALRLAIASYPAPHPDNLAGFRRRRRLRKIRPIVRAVTLVVIAALTVTAIWLFLLICSALPIGTN